MSDDTDLAGARTVLREFDLGPLPPLDLDDVVRRGHRRRRAAAVQRVAAVVAVVLVAGAGFATVHTRLQGTPTPVSTVTPTPTPTPSPSTASERVTAVMNAVASADSVHVVARLFPGGECTLDVVVTKAGAIGTLTYRGKTAQYLGVGGALYMKGDALSSGILPIQDKQIAAAHGRWLLMTSLGPSTFMNLTELSKSFYPPHGTTPALGQTRTIDGTPTIALTDQGGSVDVQYVEVDAPYRPVLVETPNHVLGFTFSNWDAPAPSLPLAPAPADVYDPSQG